MYYFIVRSGSYPSDGSSSDSGPHRKTVSYDTSTPPKPSRPKPLVRERYVSKIIYDIEDL